MNQASISEYKWVTEEMMPFLRKNWDSIDRVDPETGFCDGRLQRSELFVAYGDAIQSRDESQAKTLFDIITRYETICQSYEDGYWYGEEAELGISENDVSMYQQMVDPNSTGDKSKLKPRYWY